MVIVIIIVWFACGLYAMLANLERIPRVFGYAERADWIQHLSSLGLGPIGIFVVMSHGGRWLFWRRVQTSDSVCDE